VEVRDEWLVLRPWREDDAPAVYEECQDPEIQHWIPVIPRPTLSKTREHSSRAHWHLDHVSTPSKRTAAWLDRLT
jgi:RimJ/RimL family protein N-acetyltransferase